MSTDMTTPPRRLEHLSEAAQQALAAGRSFTTAGPPEDIEDRVGWTRYVTEIDAAIRAGLQTALPSLDALPVARGLLDIDGVPVYELRPLDAPAGPDSPVCLDIHGGAFIYGGGELCELLAAGPALMRPVTTWAVDYRMPPEHPFPAGLDDCVAVYRRAVQERGPSRVVLLGGSAGGNLAVATLLRAKEEGLPMPAGLVLLMPAVDLTESGDTHSTLLALDPALGTVTGHFQLYAGGTDLAHPHVSPLFGDLTGFPPTYLQSGTRDLLLSSAVRMHRALRAAGVPAELHVWEAMPHGGFGGAPEDVETLVELRSFLDRVLAPELQQYPHAERGEVS